MTDKRRGARRRLAPRAGEPRSRPRQKPSAGPLQETDADPHREAQLDADLDGTFPASDPVSINPGAD
jgi:hypothetical protein